MSVRYHPPQHVTPALAQRIERAEIEFCAAGAAAASAVAATLEIGGGMAVVGATGSPLNKVLGLGIEALVTDADLDAIAAFYARRDDTAQIELCPLAQAGLGERLIARGYTLKAFENEMAATIQGSEVLMAGSGAAFGPFRITLTSPLEDQLWVDVVSDAFGGPALGTVMSQFVHPAITRYLVWADDQPAGGGATFLHDGILGIFGTATLPEFRGRGVQTSLVRRCVADAQGCADLAIATVDPGSTSQRTFERLGFGVVYTRAIMSPCPGGARSR